MGQRSWIASALRCVALLAFGAVTMASSAHADKRVALVIGNSAYKSVSPLPNPAKDATAIAAMLKKAGFEVVEAREDLQTADMKKLVRDFSDKVRGADVAVVFYAGHGIEVDGTNYMIPVDAKLERDVDVEDEAVSLDRIVRILDPAKKLRLIILDACRDNPFDRSMKRSIGTRGVERGLAKVEPSNPNTLIAYAAKAGSTASDGVGANSPFTTALLKQLAVPGQDLRKSLGYVRDEVMKATGNKQEPFVYGSLGGDDVVLVPATARAAAVPAQVAALDPNSQLRRDYELAAAVNTAPAWDAFLKSYPNGFYAELARAARGKLQDASTTLAAKSTDQRSMPRDANPMAGLENFIGRSFALDFFESQKNIGPPVEMKYVKREIAIYAKSPEAISSRFAYVRKDQPSPFKPRYAQGALGEFNRGVQITFDAGKMKAVAIVGQTHKLNVTITSFGNSCQADVAYELLSGKDHFELRSPSNEPIAISALKAERLSCTVSKGDAVGQPPAAANAN